MTREETIEELKEINFNSIHEKTIMATNMAIQALEQQPCTDAISRAEAIRIASGYCHYTNIPDELAKLPSVNPKPCEDAISRQAVLDAVLLVPIAPLIKGDNVHYERVVYENVIKDLPSVTPAPKMGRWKNIKNADGNLKTYVCSECGALCGYKQKYCEECGTKMEGVNT